QGAARCAGAAQGRVAGVAALAMEKELALAASPQRKKLRVGVFADSPLQPRWIVEALAKLASAEFADVRLVEAGRGAPGTPPLAWRVYDAFDRRLFGTAQIGRASCRE